MPSADQVADRAAAYAANGTYWGTGMCLKFARTCAGAEGGVYNAAAAWANARYRHTSGTAPRGTFHFWSGGSAGHGHVAVSNGAGYTYSTDILRSGRVDRVSVAYLGARWGNLRYLGWTEDINGVRVSGLTVTSSSGVTVRLSNLKPGLGPKADIRDFQNALRAHGYARLNPSGVTSYYGDETKAMCAAFQRDTFGADQADGIPGPQTCARLGLHVI